MIHGRKMSSLIGWAYMLTMAVIASIVIFAYDPVDFYAKAYRGGFLLSNTALAAMALACMLVVCGLIKRRHARIPGNKTGNALPVLLICLLPALLVAVQVFVGYHTYALQSGDMKRMLETAFQLGRGEYAGMSDAYYAVYPNNIFLTTVFAGVMKLLMALGLETGIERFAAILMVMQILISAAGCAAGMTLCYLLTRRRRACLAFFGGYAVLIGLCGWYTSPYSDSAALAFPIAAVLLDHLCRRRAKSVCSRLAYGLVIGLLGGLSMLVKPQSAVVFLAIVIFDVGAWVLDKFKKGSVPASKTAAMLCMFLVITGPVSGLINENSGLKGDEQKRVSVLHYFYMGMNPYTNGSYASWDLISEETVPLYEDRNAQYLALIKARLGDMDAGDMVMHLVKKCLVNFSDGTFAWGYDGYQPLEEKHAVISPYLRSLIWGDGENHALLATCQQFVWICVLMLCPLAVCAGRRKARCSDSAGMQTLGVIQLSVLGIMAFNMLFEARARYVYVMAPVLLLSAILALTVCTEKEE